VKVRNIRQSLDPVQIAATGQVVERDGVVEVDDDFGCLLCEQDTNWAPADDASTDLFVSFCLWVAAVREAERDPDDLTLAEAVERATAPFVPLEPLVNPALARLAAPTAETPAPAPRGPRPPKPADPDQTADDAGADEKD
jgi:hypothetical protein